jgi:hypothetical protein
MNGTKRQHVHHVFITQKKLSRSPGIPCKPMHAQGGGVSRPCASTAHVVASLSQTLTAKDSAARWGQIGGDRTVLLLLRALHCCDSKAMSSCCFNVVRQNWQHIKMVVVGSYVRSFVPTYVRPPSQISQQRLFRWNLVYFCFVFIIVRRNIACQLIIFTRVLTVCT